MPRLRNITFALATLFATAAVVSAQNAYPAGQSTNEAFQYQDQNGRYASPSNGAVSPQSNQAYAAPNGQDYGYGDPGGAQPAPAYGGNEYPQQAQAQPGVPAVDSGIQYPAPAVVGYPYPYPYYYGYPYGYYPYYGGARIGLGFGYYGGYRGGYYPYRGGIGYGGYRGGIGFGGYHGGGGVVVGSRGGIGGGFHGGASFHGGGRR